MAVAFGEKMKLELYGESHGPCIGVKIEGLPAGRTIDVSRLQSFLDRRAPGKNAWSTARKEADRPLFRSGVKADEDGVLITTGGTFAAEIPNTNIRPGDYKDTASIPRPAHADYPAWVKYGRIPSGGGPFSARMTASLCIAGGIFLQWLEEEGIRIGAHVSSIGEIEDIGAEEASRAAGGGAPPPAGEDFPVYDSSRGEQMKALIAEAKEQGDSVGGSIECVISGLPVGIGSPVFGSVESRICQAVFAVPAVKGIEFGAGFDVCRMTGSQNNDAFMIRDGKVRTQTNCHGGILGGLTSGMPVVFRVAMKPTPSIAAPQKSVDLSSMTETILNIKGRHDPCVVPRAVPCIEAAAAVAVADLLMEEGRWT